MKRTACLFMAATVALSAGSAGDPIAIRGYYFTFSRMPTFGLPQWQEIMDCVHADGGNLVLLWIGGGFRSRMHPVTWQYNADHKNIRSDFVRDLIDYAHRRQIKVLLGLTPFSYDGVNQYALEHPELKAVQKGGNLAKLSGIHGWGYALDPSRTESKQFMMEYARELFSDFYPNADGLMIESSDYAICYCDHCGDRYYAQEFEFVREISREIWKANPGAMIVVYPHYFAAGSAGLMRPPRCRSRMLYPYSCAPKTCCQLP